MTRPRSEQISVQDTPYYHIVSRCVRRTYLCGRGRSAGKLFAHRHQWIENRIRILSSIFSVDICAYAVMSNHLHLVVKLCPDLVYALTDQQVAGRWTSLFTGPLLLQKWQKGEPLKPVEIQVVKDCVTIYRQQLASSSWLMKCLNEPTSDASMMLEVSNENKLTSSKRSVD